MSSSKELQQTAAFLAKQASKRKQRQKRALKARRITSKSGQTRRPATR